MHVLQSERLLFREYTRKDLPKMEEILGDPTTMQFWPKPYDKEGVKKWIEKNVEPYLGSGGGRLVTVIKKTNEVIGDCGLIETKIDGQAEFDLGYIIHHPHWRAGFGFEAAQALLRHGFQTLRMGRIVVQMPENHHGSRRIAEKLGMTYEKSYNMEATGFRMRVYAMERKAYLQEKNRLLVDQLGGSQEKKRWLALATSPDPASRMLALTTAEAAVIAPQIQQELLFWFSVTENTLVRYQILNLLDEHHRGLALPSATPADVSRFDDHETLPYFLAAQDDAERAVLSYMNQTNQPLPDFKIVFLRQYIQRTRTDMKTARAALSALIERARKYR